jgi:PhoH-like ATPase
VAELVIPKLPTILSDGKMKKTVFLDTNVLLHDPHSLSAFQNAHIVIPITVIAEIDKFKKGLGDVSRNAREASRQIDELRSLGALANGVKLPDGGSLTVAGAGQKIDFPDGLSPSLADDQILAIILSYQNKRGYPKKFVTMDVNMRIKAGAFGLEAVGYEDQRVKRVNDFSGFHQINVDSDWIDQFYSEGFLQLEDDDLHPNEGTVLHDTGNPDRTALGRYDSTLKRIVLINDGDSSMSIHPRNLGQRFAMNFLLDDKIKLVTLSGKAGTGKTLLALAAGLRAVLSKNNKYKRLVVSRPVFPMGKELGFLPGSLDEKLAPWMTPIYDNLDQILDNMYRSLPGKKNSRLSLTKLTQSGMLEVEPLSYIRGRSLPRQFLIVDEAQNLTPHEVKTIITRAGNDTKIVLTGDPEQIDNPYVDGLSNGLAYVIDKFRDQKISAHATLTKGERSELAEIAADLL